MSVRLSTMHKSIPCFRVDGVTDGAVGVPVGRPSAMVFRLIGLGDCCGTGPESWSEPGAAAGNVNGAGIGADDRFASTGPSVDRRRCAGGAAWTWAVVGSAGTAGMVVEVALDTSAGWDTQFQTSGTQRHPN